MAVAPYGSWKSPVSASLLARGGVGLGGMLVAGADLYWIESRPEEEGRNVVVRRSADGTISDAIPREFDARTRVHEYGGGQFFVHEGSVFCSSLADQRLYRIDPGSDPRPITDDPDVSCALRYADGRMLPDGSIVVVRESHGEAGVVIELVRLDPDGLVPPRVLASGSDFYSYPRPSPDGSLLAWTTWDHPRMPWDGTELHLAAIGDGELIDERVVAGGPDESIFQPLWGPEGALYFASDRTGWWNVYRLEDAGPRLVCETDEEFGGPQWLFGYSHYAFLPDGRLACNVWSKGVSRLALLDTESGRLDDVDLPYTVLMPWVEVLDGRVILAASSPTEARAIVAVDPVTGEVEVIRRSSEHDLDPAFVSEPTTIEFPTDDRATAHAFFYPPVNRDFEGPEGERPPLMVLSHGGPTGATLAELDHEIQFFTSRGFGVVDVNYRGSTGYGRAYREALNGTWGLADSADCINAARFLGESGEADPKRLIIKGGSAGGYTTLCALAFHDVFAAGVSYFGVADAETFVHETHNFESRYIDSLIGPYPEKAQLYRERSPIHYADQITCPVILLQGLEDEVVPPRQSEIMVDALRRNGVPFAYLAFEGEQHGFRKAETIERSAEAELYFFGRVFGFEPADDIEPVEIENL